MRLESCCCWERPADLIRGLLSGIARYASLHGPWTFYREPHAYFVRPDKTTIQDLKTWKADGAICPARRLELISPLRVPTVVLDINDYEGKIPGVVSEDLKAGQLAAQHLLGLGLDQFAFCGFESMRWSQDRCTAFCETIRSGRP